MRTTDPKKLILYRTHPAHADAAPGWAACERGTGKAWRISDDEAERVIAAHEAARAEAA